MRKRVAAKIETKDDHLKAVDLIPKALMDQRKIGETREINGWFYTSVDHVSWETSTWFNVIASQKGSNELWLSYSW